MARLYYTHVDLEGEQSLTADQVHVEEAPESADTGVLDQHGRRIRRALPRQTLGYHVNRVKS